MIFDFKENLAVEEEMVDFGVNCVKEKEIGNGIKKEPGTEDEKKGEGNGNNNNADLEKQTAVPEVVVESGPEKEKMTQF